MKMIVGSTAMRHWFPDARVPNDIDFVPVNMDQESKSIKLADTKIEAMTDEPFKLLYLANIDNTFLDPDLLMTLKMSHANWNIHWDKTMHDICFLYDKCIRPHQEIYHRLVNLWIPIHGKKPGNLNQSKDEFFGDAVKRRYDHDWLHEQVAFYDKPLYLRIRKPGADVLCDSALFYAMSPEDQKLCCYEELIVTAIERHDLRPGASSSQIVRAINDCHRKLILTMSKGWFAYEMILCYPKLHSRLGNDMKMILSHTKKVLEKLA